jgi:hypothetical protein
VGYEISQKLAAFQRAVVTLQQSWGCLGGANSLIINTLGKASLKVLSGTNTEGFFFLNGVNHFAPPFLAASMKDSTSSKSQTVVIGPNLNGLGSLP